jgi:hypothetical protein
MVQCCQNLSKKSNGADIFSENHRYIHKILLACLTKIMFSNVNINLS